MDGKTDTGNIIYTVTRPEIRGGPPPVSMYDLIRSALRSRPHGVVIGEARGAEAWELIRAAATGQVLIEGGLALTSEAVLQAARQGPFQVRYTAQEPLACAA